jgi:integrase
MSVYSVKGKGWRYDFTLKGIRYTEAWFKTKREAKEAKARRREELKNPVTAMEPVKPEVEKTPTDMAFLELINRRLDHVKAYNSSSYYQTCVVLARGWVKTWGKLTCSQIKGEMVELFILARKKVSAFTANKEIRYLKATFNFGMKKKYIRENPLNGLAFFSEEKRLKYVPPPEDIDKVIELAVQDSQDYLLTIRDTMARVSEVNRLTWDDVNLEHRYLVLYTRKKRGGHLTPRKVPLTQRLYEILAHRFSMRDEANPWVFWHVLIDQKTGEKKAVPFKDRRELIKNLCDKAGVRHFRFHALRHAGASIMDYQNVPIGAIQRILGHENRTTTEIYLHSICETEREAISAYERAMQKVSHESHTEMEKGLGTST